MEKSNGSTSQTGLDIPNPPLPPTYSLATLGVHADDPINETTDVAPAIHVSTTFRYTDDPELLRPVDDLDVPPREPGGVATGDSHIYSRASAPNTSRLELLLTSVIGAPSLTYNSGLAAFHALLVQLHPKVVAIGHGYHGCHGVLDLYKKLTHCKVVDLFDEKTWDEAGLGPGDVVHMETPVNPTGRAYDIAALAEKAHARGAVLTVDATFGPPPLQNPFAHGADFVMHSGTKYFGGHSDLLCGVLAVGTHRPGWRAAYWGLFTERIFLGSVMGSLEGWLGVRSLRTLDLRVRRQAESTTRLVAFLARCLGDESVLSDSGDAALTADDTPDAAAAASVRAVVAKLEHASLQKEDMGWLRQQMPGGFGPVFALSLRDEAAARGLPSRLRLFHHATSLGGVESLIEWRRMSDKSVDPRLCRVSVGVEDWRDLRDDLLSAFADLARERR